MMAARSKKVLRGRAVTVPPTWLVAACTSAALIVLACRPWGLGWLGWVALSPLFVHLRRCRTQSSAATASGVAALGLTSTAYEAAAALGHTWHALAIALGTAPFVLAMAAAWSVARRMPSAFAYVTFALFWALAEFLPAQTWLLGAYALPFAAIGLTQDGLPAMHLARFSSVTATSLILLLGNAFLAQAMSGRTRIQVAAPLCVAAALLCSGWLAASTAPLSSSTSFYDIAVLQPNTPTALLAAASGVPSLIIGHAEHIAQLAARAGGYKASSAAGAELRSGPLQEVAADSSAPRSQAQTISSPSGSGQPQLIVLPEGVLPTPLDTDNPLASLPDGALGPLAGLAPALIGAPGTTPSGTSANAAFLWQNGVLHHAYSKRHLVPIGEAGLAPGTGTSTVVPVVTDTGLPLRVSPLICYDIAFTATVRAAALAGAQLIAVLTDDAFAARGDVPHLHLRLARFRAVESGLPVAFASNTGPSALIDGNGALVAVSAGDQATFLRARLGEGAGPTPYVRYGNWAGALICAAAASLVVASRLSAVGALGGGEERQPAHP